MRLLLLLCLAVLSTSPYELVIQRIQLTGTKVEDKTVSCETISFFHVEDKSHNTNCYPSTSKDKDDKERTEINLIYTDTSIKTSSAKVSCEILLRDGSKIGFKMDPVMKAGEPQTLSGGGTFVPIAAAATTVPTTAAASTKEDDPVTEAPAPAPHPPKKADESAKVEIVPSAVAAAADGSAPESSKPARMHRIRGPGPVVRRTTAETPDQARRVKRADAVDPPPEIYIDAMIYVLDEAGNPAAVWAAVIEGIILLALVGACCWFFVIAPRRHLAAAAAEPYKPNNAPAQPNSYSVSYDNSGYNQRIDAFQTPAAPPRPANSSYMDDYVTDSVSAMSRPAAAQPPLPSAVNPAVSAFQPSHQRFDSSGLVTVNLN